MPFLKYGPMHKEAMKESVGPALPKVLRRPGACVPHLQRFRPIMNILKLQSKGLGTWDFNLLSLQFQIDALHMNGRLKTL